MTAQVSQLTFAKDSNRRIGMAMGIVMNQRQVDDEDAFDVLRRISQNTNRKLREVAEDVIRDRRIQADAPPATAKPLSTTISTP